MLHLYTLAILVTQGCITPHDDDAFTLNLKETEVRAMGTRAGRREWPRPCQVSFVHCFKMITLSVCVW